LSIKVAILGSTGSIGSSTLSVIKENPDNFSLNLLTANSNNKKLLEQCKYFRPKYAYMADSSASEELQKDLKQESIQTQVLIKDTDLHDVIASEETEIVVAGMVGVTGLEPVLTSIMNGKRLLLANKESYVVAGEYLNHLAEENKATIFPIDSEHSAIHQCLAGSLNNQTDVSKIILTGSGGPFFNTDIKLFKDITPEEAISHPIWNMGKKISVDSSTMMNKGLELIEARWLFNIEDIEIVIHPEGIIHSMVEFKDNSVIAQLSLPDMKIPIAYGLGYPSRISSGARKLDLAELGALNFFDPDFNRFPCLNLAIEAMNCSGNAPAALNAANEEAVSAFLDNKIGYLDIHKVIASVMDRIEILTVKEIQDIYETDRFARELSLQKIKTL
jgi:1-deoxy-D-xylulose-5-phosphate reductoisomerase